MDDGSPSPEQKLCDVYREAMMGKVDDAFRSGKSMNCIEAIRALKDGKRVEDEDGDEVGLYGNELVWLRHIGESVAVSSWSCRNDAFRLIEPEPPKKLEPPKIEGFELCEVKPYGGGWLVFTREHNELGFPVGLKEAEDFQDFAGYVYLLPDGKYTEILPVSVFHSSDCFGVGDKHKIILRPRFVAFKAKNNG